MFLHSEIYRKRGEVVITAKIAIRNIYKQKRRSFFTGLTMMVGFILMTLSLCLGEGGYSNMIEMFTRDSTSHIQIHKKSYLDKPSIYKTFSDYEKIENILKDEQHFKSAAPRVYSAALAFVGKKTTGVKIIGIDPEKEKNVTTIARKVKKGRFLKKGKYEVIISATMADILKAKLGSELVLITQAADGSIANDIFKIVGMTGKASDTSERNNCYIPIKAAQEYLALNGRIHEVAILLSHHTKAAKSAKSILKNLKNKSFDQLDVDPWQKVEKVFYASMQADKKGGYITQGIIMLIVAIGVLNTVLMSILERSKEFGVLKALGTRGRDIFSMILLEALFLSIISVVAGLVFAIPANLYFQVYGIAYPEPVSVGGIEVEAIFAEITLPLFIISALIVIVTAVLVSIIPGIRAARIVPVKALRSY